MKIASIFLFITALVGLFSHAPMENVQTMMLVAIFIRLLEKDAKKQ